MIDRSIRRDPFPTETLSGEALDLCAIKDSHTARRSDGGQTPRTLPHTH
jgi:hypothetical protein